jgi:hypothetical protein
MVWKSSHAALAENASAPLLGRCRIRACLDCMETGMYARGALIPLEGATSGERRALKLVERLRKHPLRWRQARKESTPRNKKAEPHTPMGWEYVRIVTCSIWLLDEGGRR